MVQSPQFRTDEHRMREHELRRATEVTRREGATSSSRTGRIAAGALRAMSAALARTANALDTPCERLEHDVRMIDRV